MKNILFIIFIVFSIVGYSQTKRIKILHADNTFVKPEFPGATISMGNVFVEHEGATLRCDKAYIYQEKNLIKAIIFSAGNRFIGRKKIVVKVNGSFARISALRLFLAGNRRNFG